MKTSCAGAIRGLWDELNQGLFPWIDDNIGELDAAHRLFRTVCEAVIRPREFAFFYWVRPHCTHFQSVWARNRNQTTCNLTRNRRTNGSGITKPPRSYQHLSVHGVRPHRRLGTVAVEQMLRMVC